MRVLAQEVIRKINPNAGNILVTTDFMLWVFFWGKRFN